MSTQRPVTQAAIYGGMAVGGALAIVGVDAIFEGRFPMLFGVVLLVLGGLGITLGWAARSGRRPAWAILIAMWGVLAFCSFFATPKIVKLPKLESATVEMELQMGRKKAEAVIDERNLNTRIENLMMCVLFALPFGLLCTGLALGSRDFEPRRSGP